MSMETSGTTAAPHPVGKSGAGARKQGAGNDASSEPGTPTFLALLTALEPNAAAEPGATAAFAGDGLDAASSLLLPPDASALLAQSLNRAVQPHDLDAGTSAGQADARVAGGHAAGKPGKLGGKADAPGVGGKPAAAADLAADVATAKSGAAQHASAAQSVLRRADVDRALQEAGSHALAKGAEARASESRVAADGVHADLRAALGAQAGNTTVPGAPMGDVLGAFSRAAATTRSADRPAARALFAPAGSALAGSWAEQALSGGSPAPSATYTIDAATQVPEAAVAEKLNYWISRGVQNAELQLDAFGGAAVEVSISLQGKDAQVEFRTDQPEARKLLQDAMPQLRDMLKGEGLLLSDGFVGTSARQDSGARQRGGNPRGGRSAIVSVAIQAATGTPARSGAPGRSVDLFV